MSDESKCPGCGADTFADAHPFERHIEGGVACLTNQLAAANDRIRQLLAAQMDAAQDKIGRLPIRTIRHFKGSDYYYIGEAEHTETGEALTVYMSERLRIFARPSDMFHGEVEVDGEKWPRFEMAQDDRPALTGNTDKEVSSDAETA